MGGTWNAVKRGIKNKKGLPVFNGSGDISGEKSGPWVRTIARKQVAVSTVICLLMACFILVPGCATAPEVDVYHDPAMNFPAIQTVAIMPFVNLSPDRMAAERVRDIFANALLATEAFYVIPAGEVTRGISRSGMRNPAEPSPDEIVRFAQILGVDAVITGVLREYGTVRSGSASAETISLSLKMQEAETGKVVWSSSSTKGGINTWIRLFGAGGKSRSEVTTEAVEELLDNLFL